MFQDYIRDFISSEIKKENGNHGIASYKTHPERHIEIGHAEIKGERKTESIHIINPKILDNKTTTDSPKFSDDLFNTAEPIEKVISNNRRNLHSEATVSDIPEKNEQQNKKHILNRHLLQT